MSGLDRPRARGLVHSCIVVTLSACGLMSGVPLAFGETSGLANPADRHCLDNQYELVHVHDGSGVPVSSLCVDRENNGKCESWAYFRGECSLGESQDSARSDSAPPELRSADEMQDPSVGTVHPGTRPVFRSGCASRRTWGAETTGELAAGNGDTGG